jgi:spore coat protein U-like protein
MLTRSAMIVLLAAMLVAGSHAGSAAQFPQVLLGRDPKGCVIETRPFNFGTYDPLASTPVDALGSVIYTCGVALSDVNRGVKNIRVNMSRGVTNSYDRAMTSAADHLRYNIYLDANHRTVWGDGTSNTDYYFDPHPPNKTPVTVPAYGRIFALQDVPAGNYADVLQVTILF